MALFFKKPFIAENRIENAGRWPVRLTRFHLVDDYEFPATNFPEVYFLDEGTFLHETETSTQAVREGSVFVVNPGHWHAVKHPEKVVLVRLRYLPEWLAREYEIVANSPELLALFFDQSWLRNPREEKLHAFTASAEASARIRGELDYLGQLLRDRRQLEPVARVATLRLMLLMADEHLRFWRGVPVVEFPPEVKHVMDAIEDLILRAEPYAPAKVPRGGFQKRALERIFLEIGGMGWDEYARRRRAFHAACRLLSTEEEPRRISKALGYATTAEFRKEFEAVFEIAPAVYREKFGPPRPPAEA